MSTNNNYTCNGDDQAYLADNGFISDKTSGLLGGSISIDSKVKSINISNQSEVRVNELILYYKIHDGYPLSAYHYKCTDI